MVFAGKRCFKLHRIMLMAMGLWPYQKPFIWRIQAVFFFSVYCGFLMFQLTKFLTSTCNIDCTLKRFSYICITLVYILNYYSFYFNSECIKQILEHMQLDWKMFENSDAIKILEEYLFEAYVFAQTVYIFLFIGGFIFLAFETRPIILDALIPTNESRLRKIEVELQLFVNEEQYFFLYVMQEALGVLIGIWSTITTGTFLATLGKHCCATYQIASCSIENIVTVRTLQLPILQRIRLMHRSICFSVHIHRRTVQFISAIIISFNLWYFPLILIGVLSLSCILFRLYNVIMQFHNMYDILITCLILYSCLIYMFVANFIGQSYIDHSGRILEVTYNTLWYIAPLPIQKLFLIIQKSVKCHKIEMAGLFVLSIEGFSTLITSAVSYFTFMHTMRS